MKLLFLSCNASAKLPPMTEGTKSRLAAIVSADVVGYSRLMGADETGTLAALRAHRSELIDHAPAQRTDRTSELSFCSG